jgi:hypothetical protein
MGFAVAAAFLGASWTGRKVAGCCAATVALIVPAAGRPA